MNKMLLLVLASLIGVSAFSQAKVTPLLSRELKGFPGKEGLLILVEYLPGSSDPIHRYNAHAFIYVLEGSVAMQEFRGLRTACVPADEVYIVGALGREAMRCDELRCWEPGSQTGSMRRASTLTPMANSVMVRHGHQESKLQP